MAGIRGRLIALAFTAAVGTTLLVLGCALPEFNNWWPMFVLFFYLLSPVPTMISRRYAPSVESSSALIEVCLFLTTGIVISAYGLPIVLAHAPRAAPVIQWGACGLILAGNTVVFATIAMYFYFFASDDPFDYNSW
ncbi:hypothetical protein CAPTEDRAFT_226625 [Capitella teleta]|uniref:Uncharacterized protein n=1 Tax=Capitella teleta TaxID=283909 RepID=R7TNQ3_CAPTE|nr:hypothetical protein CAPTEDRAFT_226625 [Capitella teleta]|eukprot:ELT95503.1 hypothetical protein CAPTEDRAFT_226625 [Capitella teleta]